MPVRKLNRSGGGDEGASQPIHVDDADVDIFVESLLDSHAGADHGGQSTAAARNGDGGGPPAGGKDGGGDQQQKAAGGKDGGADREQKVLKAKRIAWAPAPPALRLQQSTAEVLVALHEAKQELATEMEANLKQLKAVLQETQRIAKDMEAVLSEAKGQPAQQKQDQADQGKGARSKQETWDPPVLKKKAKAQTDDQDDDQQDDDEQQAPPSWEPPLEAHVQH